MKVPWPAPVARDDDDGHVRPFISETLDARTLYFSVSAIQSRMQIQHGDALDLEYTRLMMGFLLFHPAPAQIALIGLGGGSLVKFCHRHLKRSALTVAEINPHVATRPAQQHRGRAQRDPHHRLRRYPRIPSRRLQR